MNYAAFDVNSDSLALNKSKGISELGVITKVIPLDRERKWISSFFILVGLYGAPVLSSPWAAMKVQGLGLTEMEFIFPTAALTELCCIGS